jgi:hypothetical protein
MGKIIHSQSRASRSHAAWYVGYGVYRISWSYDYKPKGLRYTITRRVTRDTDREGAERFCKKWGCKTPWEKNDANKTTD